MWWRGVVVGLASKKHVPIVMNYEPTVTARLIRTTVLLPPSPRRLARDLAAPLCSELLRAGLAADKPTLAAKFLDRLPHARIELPCHAEIIADVCWRGPA